MATPTEFGLNKLRRLEEEQKIQNTVLPLDPEFPFFVTSFDPFFFRAEMAIEGDAHED